MVSILAGRRALSIGPGGAAGLFLQVGAHQPLKARGEELEEEESSPTEDLMREHGVVERIMLIYQRIIEKAITGQEIDVSVPHLEGEHNTIPHVLRHRLL